MNPADRIFAALALIAVLLAVAGATPVGIGLMVVWLILVIAA